MAAVHSSASSPRRQPTPRRSPLPASDERAAATPWQGAALRAIALQALVDGEWITIKAETGLAFYRAFQRVLSSLGTGCRPTR